jgi:hypothetical protein
LQQRSWGCALRSLDPDARVTVTFPWVGPTCRFLRAVHLDNFRRGTGQAEGRIESPTFQLTRHGRSHRGSWALSPRPVCTSRDPFSRSAAAILPWDLPLPGFSGRQSARSRGLVPAWAINLRKPLPAPIRSWVLLVATDGKWRRNNRRGTSLSGTPSAVASRQGRFRSRRFATTLQRVEGLMPWFSARAARVDNHPA